MIGIDDYRLIYEPNKNIIKIYLPQTMETAIDTISSVVDRKTVLSNEEQATILLVVKHIIEMEYKPNPMRGVEYETDY